MKWSELPKAWQAVYTETMWNNMSDAERAKVTKGIRGMQKNFRSALDSGKQQIKNYQSEQADFGEAKVGDFYDKGALGGLVDSMTVLEKQSRIAESAVRLLRKEVGSIVDADTAAAIAEVTQELNLKLASAKMGAEAFNKLDKNLKGFRHMSKLMTEEGGRFSASLAEQAGMLSKLNMSYNTFAANTDTAIYSLGLNEKEVRKFNLSIKDLADDMGMLPNTVSQNLRQVSQTLMYDTATIKEQFVKFQVLSNKTGVDFNTLTGGFGEKMDTISGASSAAANINALLGTNQFSATELLGMEEAERAEAIREAVMGNEAVMGDIKAGGAAGKFAMISVAEALGMSRDDARRFITTGEKGSVKGQLEQEITKRTGVDSKPGKEVSNAIVSFTKGTNNLEEAMNDLKNAILKAEDPATLKDLMIRNREENLRRSFATPGGGPDEGVYQDIGTFLGMGYQPGEVSVTDTAQVLRTSPQARESMLRIQRAARILPDQQAKEVSTSYQNAIEAAAAAETPEQKAAAIQGLKKLADQADKQSQIMMKNVALPKPVLSLLGSIKRVSPTAYQYALGFASDSFLNNRMSGEELQTELKSFLAEVKTKGGQFEGLGTAGLTEADLKDQSLEDLRNIAKGRSGVAEALAKDENNIVTKVLGKSEIERIGKLNKAVSAQQRGDQKALEAERDLIEEGKGASGGSTLDQDLGGGSSGGGVPMILKLDAAETRRLFETGQANANAEFASRVTGRPKQGRRR